MKLNLKIVTNEAISIEVTYTQLISMKEYAPQTTDILNKKYIYINLCSARPETAHTLITQ